MTPERKLIEAVLTAYDRHYIASDTDGWLLATPAVQSALAAMRGNICNPDAADEDPMVRDVEAWLAANPPATPKPEPVAPAHDVAALLDENRRLQQALVDHNDRLRSAHSVASRDGAETNWLTFRGAVTYTLAEHHETVVAARNALAKFGDKT